MAAWWYLTAGEPTGPLDDAGVAHMAGAGALSPHSLVYRDGAPDWQELEVYETELRLARNSWGAYAQPRPALPAAAADEFVELAPIGARLMAYLIDGFVLNGIATLMTLLALPMLARSSGVFGLYALIAWMLATMFVCFAYEVMLVAVRGQTVGKGKANIEVVATDDAMMGFGRATLRALVKAVTCNNLVAPLSLILWLATPNRITLHDLAAGTVVQRARY